jgi:hypothetical protein
LPLFFRSKPPITSQISSQDTPQATPQQTSEDSEENWEIFRRESSSPPPEYDTFKGTITNSSRKRNFFPGSSTSKF